MYTNPMFSEVRMEEFIRDYAMSAAILGVFAFAWFGWAQQDPPKHKKWPILLGIGSGVSFLVAVIGGILAWQNWSGPSSLANGGFTDYAWVFIVEFALIALAAGILLLTRKSKYISSTVAFIVGVHFFWLVPVFQDSWLYMLAAWVTLASIVPLFIYKKINISLVTLTCTLVAIPLFVFAVRGLLQIAF